MAEMNQTVWLGHDQRQSQCAWLLNVDTGQDLVLGHFPASAHLDYRQYGLGRFEPAPATAQRLRRVRCWA